jgi:DsbC/DsbD-like thiol-disulfide interchange protein
VCVCGVCERVCVSVCVDVRSSLKRYDDDDDDDENNYYDIACHANPRY